MQYSTAYKSYVVTTLMAIDTMELCAVYNISITYHFLSSLA